MSDQDNSIFGSNSSQETPANTNTNGVPTTSNVDELTTLLASIKNERGEQKYRTVQDALKALGHSQEYIPELSQRLKKQEEELAAAKAAAEKVAELERVVQSLTIEKPQTETPSNAGLSEDKVAELVARTLSQKEKEKIAADNLATVVSTTKQVFGEKASEVFYKRADELGMTREQFNTLAATTPKAVLKLLGIEDKVQTSNASPFTPTVNSTALTPKTDTFIQPNKRRLEVGATFEEIREETRNAKKMVEELHAQGMSVNDLTSYSAYVKHFKNKQ